MEPRTARRTAGWVLAVALVAAGLVILLRRADPPRDGSDETPAATSTPPAPPPALAGRPPADPPRDEVAPPTPPPPDEKRPASPGTLVVSVVGLPEGNPLPDADVAVRLEDGTDLAKKHSDAAGVARFDGLASDRVVLETRLPGRVPETTWVSDLALPIERRVTVRLEPGIALTGIVLVAGTSRPVPGAAIVARRGGAVEGRSVSYADGGPVLVRTRSDSLGEFRLDGIPLGDVFSIDAAALGFAPTTRSLLLGEGSRDHPRVEIALAAAASASGRVVDAEGRPVAGAEVCALAYETGKDDPARLEARLGPWGVDVTPASTATTDADGRYALDGLAVPAHYRFFARKAGATRSALTHPALHVEAATRLHLDDLALRRSSAIAIRVSGPDGTDGTEGAKGAGDPADVRVWIDLRGIDLVPERSGSWYRFEPMPPGTYVVLVSRAGSPTSATTVEVREGATVEAHVTLERGVAIEGVVVDDGGSPRAGVGVTAYEVVAEGARRGEGTGAGTDAEGRFRIEGLRAGPHRLVAHGSPAISATAPGTGVRIVLRRPGTLRLRLVLPEGATPPARVKVHVEDLDRGGGSGFDQDWKEGRIVASDLTSASVRISVSVPGYGPVLRREAVAAGEDRDLGDVALGEGVELAGRVVDGAGAPRAGARVRVILSGLLDDAIATTGTDGAFRLSRLPDGEQFVRIEAEGCVPGAERVTLGPGATTATFTLVPGVVVRGHVRNRSGAPVAEVRVVLRLEGGAPPGVPRVRSETTDDAGAFSVLVVAGSHVVEVVGPEKQVLLRLPGPVVAPTESPLALEVP